MILSSAGRATIVAASTHNLARRARRAPIVRPKMRTKASHLCLRRLHQTPCPSSPKERTASARYVYVSNAWRTPRSTSASCARRRAGGGRGGGEPGGKGIGRFQRINPMQNKLPMHLSRRCGARTRAGHPCRQAAVDDDHSTSPRHLGNLELPPAPGLLLRSMGSVNVQGRLAPSPFCGIVPKQEQF